MRRKWYSILAVLGLLLIGLTMLPTMVSAQDPEPATCTDADGYLEDGALSLAEQVYKAVNVADPKAQCALDGLQKVAQARCEVAQTKAEAGDRAGAKSTYTAVLEAYPDLPCAVDGLAALAPATCPDADGYLKDGALSLAEQVYKAVNEADPKAQCALDGLQNVAEARCEVAQTKAEAGDRAGAKSTYTAVLEAYPDLQCATDGLASLAPASCSDADGYLKDGALSLAEQVYKAVNEADPEAQCALDGLQKVAEARCEIAQTKAEAGDLEGAKSTYTAILEAYPDLQCATDGLVDVISNDFEKVVALHEAGMDEKAWEQLETAVKAAPTNKNLAQLVSQPWARWQRYRAFLTLYLQPAVGALVGIIVVVVLLILLARFVISRLRLKLDIEQFSVGALKLDPDPSSDLVARVELALMRLGEDNKTFRPGLIDQPVQYTPLPAGLTSVPKEVGQLWNFFIKLWPAKTVALSSVLQYDKIKGAGLSLKLVYKRTNAVWDIHTIWQRDVNPNSSPGGKTPTAADYFRLADAAAVWTYWQIYQKKNGLFQGRTRQRLRQSFGTDKWQSYIANYFGAQLVNAGKDKHKDAKVMLRMALAHDRKNRFALFNLAMVNVEAEEPNYTEAITLFKRAKDLFERPILRKSKVDTVTVFANYQLGAIEAYRFINKEISDLKTGKESLKLAVDQAEQSKSINEEVQATLKIVYLSALVLDGGKYPHQSIKEIETEHFSSALLYNLACYYSTAAEFGVPNNDFNSDTALNEALKYLKKAVAAHPDYYTSWPDDDPSIKWLKDKRPEEFNKLVNPPKPVPPVMTFSLKEMGKIKSDLKDLKPGDENAITVILVVKSEDAESKTVTHEAHRYDSVTLIDVLDASGTSIKPPYTNAHTVLISLLLDAKGTALAFAAHLADASAIYLIAPLSPAPSPSKQS